MLQFPLWALQLSFKIACTILELTDLCFNGFFDNFVGTKFLINALKGMQMLSSSISITHASNEPLACIELVTKLFQLWF